MKQRRPTEAAAQEEREADECAVAEWTRARCLRAALAVATLSRANREPYEDMRNRTTQRAALIAVRAALLAAVVVTFYACRTGDPTAMPADARAILRSHISHGIGDSPLDSPLIGDSLAAAMIVRARGCVATDTLRNLHAEADKGAQLLERLQTDGLVVVREDRSCTTFPILIDAEQALYAQLTDEVADGAFQELSSEFATIIRLIGERDWNDWQYHFLWSQLFDSQFAWTEMMTRSLVPPLAHLIAWVVFPDHSFRSGTNYYPDTELRDYWLMVTWRAGAANTTGPVGGSWDLIYRAGVGGAPLTDDETTRLVELGAVDETGQLRWPVLRSGDPLHDLLQEVAGRYVRLLEQRMPLDQLVHLSGVDRQHAFAMANHDVSWGVLGRLTRSGQIDVPPPLTRGGTDAQLSMSGVAALSPVYPPFEDLIKAAIESR